MELRPLKIEDFTFTDADVQRALREFEFLAISPRPYGTFNPINILCAICQQELGGDHHCTAMIACTNCGEIHPIQLRGC